MMEMNDNVEIPANAERRPWGWYVTTFEAPGYKTKVISVLPHSRLSLQSHARRREKWSVVSGKGICTVGDQVMRVDENSFVSIPTGARHRIENDSDGVLVFAEVQIGDYLEEDDIVRYEDDFGRENAK